MNATCQAGGVRVAAANDYPRVGLDPGVPADEIPAVEGEHSAVMGHGEGQNSDVANALAALPSLLDRLHVVAELPQVFHDRVAEVLVRIQPGHDQASSLSLIVCSISSAFCL